MWSFTLFPKAQLTIFHFCFQLTNNSAKILALCPRVFSGFLRLHPSPEHPFLLSQPLQTLKSQERAERRPKPGRTWTWLVSNSGHSPSISNLSKRDSGETAPFQLPALAQPKILTPSSVSLHHSVSTDTIPFTKYLERTFLMSSNLNSDTWPAITAECSYIAQCRFRTTPPFPAPPEKLLFSQ